MLSRQIMLILPEHFNDVCAKTSQLCKLRTWPSWPIITLHKRAVEVFTEQKIQVNKRTNHTTIFPKISLDMFMYFTHAHLPAGDMAAGRVPACMHTSSRISSNSHLPRVSNL